MTDASDAHRNAPFAAECERVALLARCVEAGRPGSAIPSEWLDSLRDVQSRVETGRATDPAWLALRALGLSPLESDVLACVAAPECEPAIGWHYQSLQPTSPAPYPSAALLRELLALDAEGARALRDALSEGGALRRHQLVEVESEGPFVPIRPGPGVVARLLHWEDDRVTPPGAMPVSIRPAWSELVLPPDRMTALREFLLWIRKRDTVVEDWGARDFGGPLALFAGPSGTGKTFAGAVVAAELSWPLYRVDLGRLVSKYIGETEKNLNRLFEAAHGRDVVLQIDEADSLFSKRGEVREARDRYANMEVSHLLARVEYHRGPVILTSNLPDNLDAAFTRRFQMVVDFPRPDAIARASLWERLLPPKAPRAPDLDLPMLGRAANLTGGGIRNAALHAAFLAAGHGGSIGLEDIARAVWRELSKAGRQVTAADLGPLAEHLRTEDPT